MYSNLQTLRGFADNPDFQTRSGVFPQGAVSEAPELDLSGEFSHPHIPDSALQNYSRIAALGPNREHEDAIAQDLFSNDPSAALHPDIGWYLGLYAGYVTDDDDRIASSSGGVATALLTELLDSGTITGVIHFHSGPNGTFGYGISRSRNEIRLNRKTRYFPGSLFDALNEVRVTPGKYAIVGIPSFLSEVRRLAKIEPLIHERITVFIGLICGHQKSANYLRYLAWQAGIDSRRLIGVDFRAKRPVAKANEYSTLFSYLDGEDKIVEKLCRQQELTGTNWGLGLFKSQFSDFTDDAFNETADVVLGDAWLPEYTSDYRGTNIVITRSREMEDLLVEMQRKNLVHVETVSPERIVSSQTALVRHSRREIGYRRQYALNIGVAVPAARSIPDQPPVRFFRRAIQRQRMHLTKLSRDRFVQAIHANSINGFMRSMHMPILKYRILDKLNRIQNKFGPQGPVA